MRAILLALVVAAAPATAETPLSADAFEELTTGRTLIYSLDGQSFGIEEYLPGRRVVWSFLDGQCEDGVWYPVGEMICFAYETYPEDQCWTFHLRDGRLFARFANDPESTALYETRESPEPLMCLGPEVGV